MLTQGDVQKIARQEAAQLLADFALHLKTIAATMPATPIAEAIDMALGVVITPILKPNADEKVPK